MPLKRDHRPGRRTLSAPDDIGDRPIPVWQGYAQVPDPFVQVRPARWAGIEVVTWTARASELSGIVDIAATVRDLRDAIDQLTAPRHVKVDGAEIERLISRALARVAIGRRNGGLP